MRVGLIIYGSIDTVTGGYIYDQKLLNYLKSQGVEVKIFSQSNKNIWTRFRNNFNLKIIKEILLFSPHILLQDSMNYLSLFLFNRKIKKLSNFPIICIVNAVHCRIKSHFLKTLLIKNVEKCFYKSVDGFIFNSISAKESVTQIVGTIKNSVLAYPGKDRLRLNIMPAVISQKSNWDQLMIMFIGNLSYNKGLHILLHALSEIDKQLWSLSIIGGLHFDDKYSKKIIKQIAHLQLANNIRILGQLDSDNLRKELTLHHVLAVPSYYESFGIVYAEAMGAGLSIIASQSGGAQEIVIDTINGFLVRPGDAHMVKEAICKLIANRQLLLQMCLSSLSAYNQMPTWEESMKLIYQFLMRFF